MIGMKKRASRSVLGSEHYNHNIHPNIVCVLSMSASHYHSKAEALLPRQSAPHLLDLSHFNPQQQARREMNTPLQHLLSTGDCRGRPRTNPARPRLSYIRDHSWVG